MAAKQEYIKEKLAVIRADAQTEHIKNMWENAQSDEAKEYWESLMIPENSSVPGKEHLIVRKDNLVKQKTDLTAWLSNLSKEMGLAGANQQEDEFLKLSSVYAETDETLNQVIIEISILTEEIAKP